MMIEKLADVIKRRGIQRVYYFHTDHFEPWSKTVNEEAVRGVDLFAQMSRKSRFASPMNLFYHTYLPYRLDAELAAKSESGVDAVQIGGRSPQQDILARQAMLPLEAEFGHEVHIHVHHESWTRNTGEYSKDVSKWVNTFSNAELDKARLNRALILTKEYIANDIGRPIEHWAFVHGNWALNGSDRSICWIDDEIELLMKHGCFGDFTFPAGRRHCDPVNIETPYTCVPLNQAKGYDLPEAQPQTIESGADPLESGRFFIWNSPIKAQYSSLDYYDKGNRELFATPARVVGQWLENCVVLGDSLFIKTHAHSMNGHYEIQKGESPIPHLYPDVVAMFELLEKVCDFAAVPIEVLSINNLMDRLKVGQEMTTADVEVPAELAVVAPPTAAEVAQVIDDLATLWVNGDIERLKLVADRYADRIESGKWISDAELTVIEHLLTNYPPDATKVCDLTPGLGGYALVLAALGYEVLSFASDPSLLAGFNWLRQEALRRYAIIGQKHQIIEGAFAELQPKGLIDDAKANILIGLDLISPAVTRCQDRILRQSQRFTSIVIDPARFGVLRSGDFAIRSFSERLERSFEKKAEVFLKGTSLIAEYAPKSPLVRVAQASAFVVTPVEVLTSVTPVLEQWISELDAAGLKDDFFADKIRRLQILDRREVAVAGQMLRQFDPATTRIVEIGSACGALALLLAANGFDVFGMDGNVRRAAVAEIVLQRWTRENPGVRLNLQFDSNLFPRGMAAKTLAPDRRNVLFATNIVSTYSSEHQSEILLAASQFDDIVIDLGRFGANRDQVEQRQELLHVLANGNFEPQRVIYYGAPNEFWHFRVRPVLE